MMLAFSNHSWNSYQALHVLHFREAFIDAQNVVNNYFNLYQECLHKISNDKNATQWSPFAGATPATIHAHTAHLICRNRLPISARQCTSSYFLVRDGKSLFHYWPSWLYVLLPTAKGWEKLAFSAPLSWGETTFEATHLEGLVFFHNQTPQYLIGTSSQHPKIVRLGDLLDENSIAQKIGSGPLFSWKEAPQ